MAQGAAASGVTYILSTMATASLEEVAGGGCSASGPLLFAAGCGSHTVGTHAAGLAVDVRLKARHTLSMPAIAAEKGVVDRWFQVAIITCPFLPATCHCLVTALPIRMAAMNQDSCLCPSRCVCPSLAQIYVLTQRDVTETLVRDAEALGYTALVVTVDAPRLGQCRLKI